jgi:hypothetical protein
MKGYYFYLKGINDGKDRSDIFELYRNKPLKKELSEIKARLVKRNSDLCNKTDLEVENMYCLVMKKI